MDRVRKDLKPLIIRVGHIDGTHMRWIAKFKCEAGHRPKCTPDWAMDAAEAHAVKLNHLELIKIIGNM